MLIRIRSLQRDREIQQSIFLHQTPDHLVAVVVAAVLHRVMRQFPLITVAVVVAVAALQRAPEFGVAVVLAGEKGEV